MSANTEVQTSISKKESGEVIFAPITVDESHWSRAPVTSADPMLIASFQVEDECGMGNQKPHYIQIKLNPTDARGYRCIICLTDAVDPTTTLNREYTLAERIALFKVLSLATQVYTDLGMIAQCELLGNNSHSFDVASGAVTVGATEPSILHGHVIGRGNPLHSYIEDVPLRGPEPGELFQLREGKVLWSSEKQSAHVARQLAAAVSRVVAQAEKGKLLGGVKLLSHK